MITSVDFLHKGTSYICFRMKCVIPAPYSRRVDAFGSVSVFGTRVWENLVNARVSIIAQFTLLSLIIKFMLIQNILYFIFLFIYIFILNIYNGNNRLIKWYDNAFFLDHYQCESFLWDLKHQELYKDKKRVNDGWFCINELLNIPVADFFFF